MAWSSGVASLTGGLVTTVVVAATVVDVEVGNDDVVVGPDRVVAVAGDFDPEPPEQAVTVAAATTVTIASRSRFGRPKRARGGT